MNKKTTKRKTTKAVAVREVTPPAPQFPAIPQTQTGQLLQMAVDKNLDVDKLERLIEMKNKEEDRAAKKDFDFHFGEMQSRFPTVRKTKAVKNRSQVLLYKYCPLENIVKVLGPIIKDHGFSFWFSSEMIEGKENEMRIFCHISGWGHEKTNHIDFPIIKGTDATNRIQERGITETYGQRYAFKAGFGFVIAGEDEDARGPEPEYTEPRKVGEDAFDKVYADMNKLYGLLLTDAKVKKGIASLEQCALIKERVLELKETKDVGALQSMLDEWSAAYNERKNEHE